MKKNPKSENPAKTENHGQDWENTGTRWEADEDKTGACWDDMRMGQGLAVIRGDQDRD